MAHLSNKPKLMRNQNLISRLQLTLQVLTISFASAIAVAAQETTDPSSQDSGLVSMLFSGYGITILLVLVLVALVVAKKIRASRSGWEDVREEPKKTAAPTRSEPAPVPRPQMVRSEPSIGSPFQPNEPQWESSNQTGPDAAFGAYRIDQEVWKLIL